MNTREELFVCGYVRQNFERKCLIREIIATIVQFFKDKGGCLYVCGNGDYGRLGIKEFDRWDAYCMEPTRVKAVKEIIDVATLNAHTMLVDYKGSIWAFGKGEHGALGTGNTENVIVPKQIQLNNRAIAVSVGVQHSLILIDNGNVLSCGQNSCGQLGRPHIDSQCRYVPKIIESLKEHKIIQISAGGHHNGALSEKGNLFMWGSDKYGQCGIGKREERRHPNTTTPTTVKLKEKVSAIDCGSHHSLLITNKHLYSFGFGRYGQLGHETNEDKHIPTLIELLKNVNFISVAGGESHTLCIDDDFSVWGFGDVDEGQCGHSRNIHHQESPKKIEYFAANNIKAKEVEAGANSSCVIAQNNECFVFGNNKKYQLGLKKKRYYFDPKKLPLFVQKASMGYGHSTFIDMR